MRSGIAIAAMMLAACSRPRARADSSADTVVATPATPTPTTQEVTPYGMAPLRAGMTLAEAKAVMPSLAFPPDAENGACSYAAATGLPDGTRVMVESKVIARVEVFGGKVRTAEGVGVRNSEARVKEVYGSRVKVTPHKYLPAGHYLTVRPAAPADSIFALVFETDGARVVTFRAGHEPQVHYIEGCS